MGFIYLPQRDLEVLERTRTFMAVVDRRNRCRFLDCACVIALTVHRVLTLRLKYQDVRQKCVVKMFNAKFDYNHFKIKLY